MTALRVAVLGAAGRMGTAVCAAVSGAPDLELVAAVDPAFTWPGSSPAGFPPAAATSPAQAGQVAALGRLAGGPPHVAVDFTTAEALSANAAWCAGAGVHLVAGTTGLSAAQLGELASLFPAGGGTNCVLAANFAVSAVLMMRFAELAAPYFDGVEIVELHHDDKSDAPSGTALETGRRIAAARAASGAGAFAADPTRDGLPGARGAGGGSAEVRVPVHSVRLRGLVAHQEVLFGSSGQSLTIRQDSYDRGSFMPGVLLATRRVGSLDGLTVGLDAVLGL